MEQLTNSNTLTSRSARMKEARMRAGLGQREAARLMKIGQTRLSNYENEVNKVPDDILKIAANLYKCSLEYLHGFISSPEGDLNYRPINEGSVIALNSELLKKHRLTLDDLVEVVVTDNAMHGEFNQGSTVIVSNKVGQINAPAIYAIAEGDVIRMRGLRKELSGEYTLFVHDKQNYNDLPLSENALKKLSIVGKYIGHWRSSYN
ncbi:helix-turn-helix domain-containing protein [Pseudoalteromonas rhizosphaerae]|uniref:helix-turn-helix domain-containing protein n=1 Tax=Pseudoalteromonas rhizosphaerae TaxID=2518973 RepID=UPI001230CC76|nr:helix-turn-helix transcriptional regulator [Pseudoalteromonas rhizosphaerae]